MRQCGGDHIILCGAYVNRSFLLSLQGGNFGLGLGMPTSVVYALSSKMSWKGSRSSDCNDKARKTNRVSLVLLDLAPLLLITNCFTFLHSVRIFDHFVSDPLSLLTAIKKLHFFVRSQIYDHIKAIF